MPGDLAGLRRDRTKASTRMTELATAARGRSMTDDEQRDFDAAVADVTRLEAQITEAEAAAATPPAATIGRADAAEIAKLCADGGVPAMAATLLAKGVSVDEAKVQIAAVGEARNVVALARRKDPSIPEALATDMLAQGKTVQEVRDACFDRLVAGEEKTAISSHVAPALGTGTAAATQASMEREIKRAGLAAKKEG